MARRGDEGERGDAAQAVEQTILLSGRVLVGLAFCKEGGI